MLYCPRSWMVSPMTVADLSCSKNESLFGTGLSGRWENCLEQSPQMLFTRERRQWRRAFDLCPTCLSHQVSVFIEAGALPRAGLPGGVTSTILVVQLHTQFHFVFDALLYSQKLSKRRLFSQGRKEWKKPMIVESKHSLLECLSKYAIIIDLDYPLVSDIKDILPTADPWDHDVHILLVNGVVYHTPSCYSRFSDLHVSTHPLRDAVTEIQIHFTQLRHVYSLLPILFSSLSSILRWCWQKAPKGGRNNLQQGEYLRLGQFGNPRDTMSINSRH